MGPDYLREKKVNNKIRKRFKDSETGKLKKGQSWGKLESRYGERNLWWFIFGKSVHWKSEAKRN